VGNDPHELNSQGDTRAFETVPRPMDRDTGSLKALSVLIRLSFVEQPLVISSFSKPAVLEYEIHV
jgi:hypothetical protein